MKKNKYYSETPQPWQHWVAQIKDKTVNKYLTDICQNEKIRLEPDLYKELTSSFCEFMGNTFAWQETPQGYSFWNAIYLHFSEGKDNGGLKTYEDFKHLDQSVPTFDQLTNP